MGSLQGQLRRHELNKRRPGGPSDDFAGKVSALNEQYYIEIRAAPTTPATVWDM